MTEEELRGRLGEIKAGVKMFETMINFERGVDGENPKYYITERQHGLIKALFDLFSSLNWQIALNSYKKLNIEESPAIKTKVILGGSCGTPVKIRPCGEEYGDKTYFGILLGDVPLSLHASIDPEGTINVSRSMYNPAIFVPELKDIIYGCGSWWGEIENEEELDKLITDDVIENVWYVKMLKGVKE